MNENVGASFGLSVLIVVFFAVILYQPDAPAPPAAAVRAPAPSPREDRGAAPPPEEPPSPREEVAAIGPEPSRPPAVVRPVSHARRPAEPRGAFTTVRDGESLADVARRVYGRTEDSRTLWLANRDRLDGPESPVIAGSVLRTP